MKDNKSSFMKKYFTWIGYTEVRKIKENKATLCELGDYLYC